MAFNSRSAGSNTTLAEINVTPLVDVLLVLLIILMVSAPMMQQGIQVDLPKANAGSLNDTPDQVVLTVTKSRQILFNGRALEVGTLRPRLEAMVAAKPGLEVFIHADQAVPYGVIAQVMAEVKRARVNRLGLVTEPGDPNQKM